MSETKGEYTRVIVQIKRVWLAVRFNCKLSFIIRNELSQKVAETDNTYALFKGECLVNETLYFQIPQDVLAGRAKKLKLVVMMISANGMVPAGFVSFNTQWRSPYEQFEVIVPLQRCEDSRAQIKFMHMYESCTRTSLQQSYANQLIARQDRHLTDHIALISKQHPSHSLNKHYSTARKSQIREQYLPVSRAPLPKPLLSPRLLLRDSELGTSEKSVRVTSFKKEEGRAEERKKEEKIVEEANESSINPLTKEQLVKEHQQYWLQIIKMEEEMEIIKEENRVLKQENQSIKKENACLRADTNSLKDYYEGHEEKIHALLSELHENTDTIKALELQLEQSKAILAQKEQTEQQFQKLLDMQAAEGRKHQEKLAQLNEQLHAATQAQRTSAHKLETQQQTIFFLQEQAQKQDEQNARLSHKTSEYEDRLYFLTHNNQSQKNMIIELEGKVSHLAHQADALSALEQQNHHLRLQLTYLNQQIDALKESDSQGRQVHVEQPLQMITLEQPQKEEAEDKLSQSLKELKSFKDAYQTLSQSASLQQQKMIICERQLQTANKEKNEYLLVSKRKEQELIEAKAKIEDLSVQVKAVNVKLTQQDALVQGKIILIQQLKSELATEAQQSQQLLQKNLAIQKEFEEMEMLLQKEVQEKNKITILLTTLQDSLKTIDLEKSQLSSKYHSLQQHCQQLTNQKQHLENSLQEAEQSHNNTRQQLQASQQQLRLSQEQLTDVIERANTVEIELQSTLAELDKQKTSRNSVRDQYQDSYNQSMTAVTLKNGKLEKELDEIARTLQKERNEAKSLSDKLTAKEAEVIQIKGFTHTRLQQNLKLMKENQECKAKLIEAQKASSKLQEELTGLLKVNEELRSAQQESLIRIDQLKSELQFVTEVLQRERQDKSDIQKEIDHLQKAELPHIQEVGQLKEESFDQHRQEDVQLQIESKLNLPSQQTLPSQGGKAEPNKKRKKKT